MDPSEIDRKLAELTTTPKEWGLKIGGPARTYYSEHVWPILELYEAISTAGSSYCRYVDMFCGSACCSRQFEGSMTFEQLDQAMLDTIARVKEAVRIASETKADVEWQPLDDDGSEDGGFVL